MSKQRLSEVDGLRGVAALTVMIGHWGEIVQRQNVPVDWKETIQTFFLDDWSFGRVGIVAFFCISGFVVPFSFRGERPMLSFPISRFFRLYPAYWMSILVAAILFPLVGRGAVPLDVILPNLTMLHKVFGIPSVLSVYWTLTIELVFYGICYAMFWAHLLHSVRANFAAMLAFLAVALAAGAYRWFNVASDLPVGIPTYLAAMHFGTIARLRMRDTAAVSSGVYGWALALLIGGVLAANTLAYLHATNEVVGWKAANLGYVAGVVLFLGCIHRQWFRGGPLPFLGLISYSMYLFHMAVVAMLDPFWSIFPDTRVAALVFTPLYIAVTIGIAVVVHRFVEKPSIGFGRRIETIVVQRRPMPRST